MRKFRLTAEHLKLLRRANIRWCGVESGAPGVDHKRPYGNSDVPQDVALILDWEPIPEEDTEGQQDQRWRAARVHLETELALQVVCSLAGQEALPGLYCEDECGIWRLSGEAGASLPVPDPVPPEIVHRERKALEAIQGHAVALLRNLRDAPTAKLIAKACQWGLGEEVAACSRK